MAKRRRGPTLLEVLPHDMRRPSDQRTGLPVSAPPPIAAGDGERLEMSSPFGWLSPGQVVRLPVGYILIAAAGVIILAAATFFMGHNMGRRAERLETEERYRTYGSPTATDPLVGDYVDPVGAAASQGDASDRETTAPAGNDDDTTMAATETETRETTTPVRTDPGGTNLERVRGLNYWIVTSYATPEEGEQLIQFLAENGVPARAFPNSNSEFVQVWVMRGFTREELRTPAAPAFERELRRLGRIWKNERDGTDDLATMYKKKY